MTSRRFFRTITALELTPVQLLQLAMTARSTGSAEPEDGAAPINAVESVGFDSAVPTSKEDECNH
jgi:hypothetical protein